MSDALTTTMSRDGTSFGPEQRVAYKAGSSLLVREVFKAICARLYKDKDSRKRNDTSEFLAFLQKGTQFQETTWNLPNPMAKERIAVYPPPPIIRRTPASMLRPQNRHDHDAIWREPSLASNRIASHLSSSMKASETTRASKHTSSSHNPGMPRLALIPPHPLWRASK